MINHIELPDHTSKDAVFFVLLLQGHILNKENFPKLTGIFDTPPRYWRLKKKGISIHVEKYPTKTYITPIAFYSMKKSDVEDLYQLTGKKRVEAFIERVVKHWQFSEDVKKGLQSKPQPLSTMLAGKLTMEVANV